MKKKSLRINAILSVCKVFLNIIFPLITFPYVSRVLLAENLGKVNYTKSIIDYFSLLASLGVSTYAIREGARIREEREIIQNFVSEIFTSNLITTFVAYVLLWITLFFVPKFANYKLLIIIQSIAIINNTFGVDWVNVIYEDYLYILIRSFIIQIVFIICLFLYVKKPEDYYIYACLCTLNTGIISILNIVHIRKYCLIKITKKPRFFKHIKSLLIFFASNMAATIYLSSDTTMIGWIIGDYSTGIYAVAVKIYTVIKTLLNAIYSVAIPRLSALANANKISEYKKLCNELITYIVLIGIPGVILLFSLSDILVVIVAGREYIEASIALKVLSISLIFAVSSGIFVTCLNTTLNREFVSLQATSVGAIINICLNIFLIPILKQNGAAITTAVAELMVTVICISRFKNMKDYIEFKVIKNQMIDSFLGGIPMITVCALIKKLNLSYFFEFVLTVTGGMMIYISILLMKKNVLICKIVKYIKNYKSWHD